ncbi:hypothetical protein ARMA_3108 [Ardenticatena maritima]|uniref:Uncharacterized protein n=1 Tax=Ardenticatena maritima TaxID=872965 RepID=A0A0M8K9T8_9CHLR|nr:hypothetical protein ARMA_3108 [Ardenticatena maritima]
MRTWLNAMKIENLACSTLPCYTCARFCLILGAPNTSRTAFDEHECMRWQPVE